jgi:hypothetical protein
MSLFNATGSASGYAYTSTVPPYLVTSNASATASANSEDIAKEIANNTAKQLANSVAQNDANIISQALNISPAGVIGEYNYLNLSYAVKTPINGQGEFNGLIIPSGIDESIASNALVLTVNKEVYDVNTLQVIPNSMHLGTFNGTFYNYGGRYGDKIVYDKLLTSSTPKSFITSNRNVFLSIPSIQNNIQLTYIIKLNSYDEYYLNGAITNSTEYSDINKNMYSITIYPKSLTGVQIINENENTIASYTCVNIKEIIDTSYIRITLDFSKAIQTSVIQNIYPAKITT